MAAKITYYVFSTACVLAIQAEDIVRTVRSRTNMATSY